MLMPTPLKIGKFEVLGTLGRGASSTLLKIRRQADNKLYALKVIRVQSAEDRRFVDQAEHEFIIGSHLNHPNLVRVYAFEKQRSFFRVTGAHLLLEFVDGLPLTKCGILPLPRLVKIFFRVADGLTYMHQHDVFHADMKPANIMVTTDGNVKIIDFGLTWRRGEDKGRVQGTIEFLAPEQAKRRIVTEKTDIFNLGATMYRVFAGKPFPSLLREAGTRRVGDVESLLRPITEENPAVPAALGELIHHCVRIDPAARPACIAEVRDRLRAIGKALKHPEN